MARETEETESSTTKGKKEERKHNKTNQKTPAEYSQPIRNRGEVRRRRRTG
jgi:hypothetical protein